MDILNSIVWFSLAWTLVQAFQIIFTRGQTTNATKHPPGPVSFLIIGSLLKLGNKPNKSLAKLAEIYGPIMSLKLGQITTVVISSATMAKEVLQKQDLTFANRYLPDAMKAHNHAHLSVAWIPISPKWRSLRKILNFHIFASQKLDGNQHLRRHKVKELLSDVEESCKAGVAVDIGRAAFKTTLNLMSNTIFSVDLAAEDPRCDNVSGFKEVATKIMEDAGKPNLVDYFPLLRLIDPHGIRSRMTAYFGKLFELFDSTIDKRLQSRKEDGFVTSNDVLDTLLSISEDRKEDLDREDIKHLLLDLFVAATDTTTGTLEWAMAELLRDPKTLSKAKSELDRTIGRGNQVEESDITRLPYLQAIVKETFRLHPTIPLLLPRTVEADTELCGYTIPKGAQVVVNAWAIGRDPSTWENPNSFVPERFLGSSIDVRGHDFELIPFGAGRRMCPGLPLGIRMVHLMLGSLIHTFDWKLEGGVSLENLDMDDKFGLSLRKAKPLLAVPIYM